MMSVVPARFSNICRGALCVTLLAGLMFTSTAISDNEDVATGSAAAAIREAGYPCAHVTNMERSKEAAAEGFTIWKVRCNSGGFKVTFKGDAGSEVVPLD